MVMQPTQWSFLRVRLNRSRRRLGGPETAWRIDRAMGGRYVRSSGTLAIMPGEYASGPAFAEIVRT